MTVPYSFGSATSAIPLSQLDSNFNTPITLGNTAIQLGNTVTTLNNMTLANVTVSSGTITLTDISASGNVTLSGGTANGVAYLNGSKVVTTGSALTFDGTNLKVAGETSITGGSQSALNALHLYFDTGTNTSFIKSYHSGVDDRDLTIGARNIAFQVPNGTEIGRFTSTGLGIGLGGSSPSYKLDVDRGASNGIVAKFGRNSGQAAYIYADTSSVYFGSDNGANTAWQWNESSDYLAAWTAGIERMRLDSSGNLGLGVTPSAWRSVFNAFNIGRASLAGATGSSQFQLTANAYQNSAGNWIYRTTDTALQFEGAGGAYKWYTAASGTAETNISFGDPKMTLDASGNLLVGKTSTGLGVGVQLEAGGGSSFVRTSSVNSDLNLYVYSTGASAARFYVGMGGTVYATSTTITAISDQRLKENIRDLDDGLDVVMALKPRKFDWKEGKGQNIKDARGFIAQEFEQILPDMVEKWADPVPEGEEPYKAINANLIPTLVKAIQEQQAIIETLTARIAALEAK